MTYTENWIGHIIAGILGVIFSLSIVYMKMEKRFSVHQKINPEKVKDIVDASGRSLTASERERFIQTFNEANYLGRNSKYIPDFSDAVRVDLMSGIQLYCAQGQRFVEIMRVNPKGRKVYYWLLNEKNAEITG